MTYAVCGDMSRAARGRGPAVQQKGFGESLRLRRRHDDHLIAPDLRLLAMRASGRKA
jgi:hypothetical protein